MSQYSTQIASDRREYQFGKLTADSLSLCPFSQFDQWMNEALAAKINDPTAMCLATVDATGQPWQRTVLLKGVDSQGFRFFTHLHSRKGQHMAANPRASLLFPWYALDRQVIVSGTVVCLPRADVEAYFSERPRTSQLGAWASEQSVEIASREILDAQLQALANEYDGVEIPAPPHWGGYLLRVSTMEFWQGGENRLHDRFFYQRNSEGMDNEPDSWRISRLSP